ncbi:hypothetical protein Poli38472_002906 [Pythium oligandrum]|uniref:Uncharacterized protein n=1 Tax=Pythium oligandrum TaxID=41045 RepID=A0A8K1C5U2_PYTOL|nr:hypothetical protein Poli38472_002906 [Pythium oligandrum]|eukprot:TMW56981.1 hypothetical protein Poli38472_002906 [Pythium oligandrum]
MATTMRWTLEEATTRVTQRKTHVLATRTSEWTRVDAYVDAVAAYVECAVDENQRLDGALLVVEEAVAVVYHWLQTTTPSTVWTESMALVGTTARQADPTYLRSAFARVLVHRVDGPTDGATLWTHLGVVLSALWLSTRASTHAVHTESILNDIVHHGANVASLSHQVTWAYFLLAMLHAVRRQDVVQALALMQKAKACELAPSSDRQRRQDGVVSFWYAVLLHKSGLVDAANEQLHVAVRRNHYPVASLRLSALGLLASGDFYEASEALQRCIEMDAMDATSLFNYAMLLKRIESVEAAYQMLEYVVQASEDAHESPVSKTPVRSSLFAQDDLNHLLPTCPTSLSNAAIALEMARTAVEMGSWQEARAHYEEYFASVSNNPEAEVEFVYVLLQANCPSEALERCQTALSKPPSVQNTELCMLKADALLCLERVEECCQYLKTTVEPLVATASSQDNDLVSKHIQLLNNLAVALVCSGNSDRAMELLRQGMQQYPGDLCLKFNVVLLLWRVNQQDAACTLWFQARNWSLHMSADDLREKQSMIRSIEHGVAGEGFSRRIESHVDDDDGNGSVSQQQLLFVDSLVLQHWGKAQGTQAQEMTASFVDYLEAVSARLAKKRYDN